MKKYIVFLLLVLSLSSMTAHAATVENGGSSTTVLNAVDSQLTTTDVDLLVERQSGKVLVTLFLATPTDISAGAFNVKVPAGLEFERAIKIEKEEGTILENDPDAIQNEDSSVDVEFLREGSGAVSGEILQLIFIDNPSISGDFELVESEDNFISQKAGEPLYIIGKSTLTASPTQATTSTTPTTPEAPLFSNDTPTVATPVSTTTTSTGTTVGKTGTGMTASGATTGTGSVSADATKTETGLATNLFLLAVLLLMSGVYIVKRKEQQA